MNSVRKIEAKLAALGRMLRPVSMSVLIGAVLAFGLFATSAHASFAAPSYYDYLNFTSSYAISDIVRFNVDNGSSGGIGWGGTPPNGWSAAAGYNGNALGYGSPNGVNNWFFMGLTTGLPGDAPGQQHAVLFTNTAFATSAVSIAWGTLFPHTNETTIITDLQTMDNTALNDLGSFAYGSGDAVTGPNGPVSFTPGSNFSIIAFSGGQIIGQGTSVETSPSSVPIPGALMLLGPGLVGLAAIRRRFKK